MVMFHCTPCNERMPTCHPAYRPPDDLDLELLGRPKTNKSGALPSCCIDVATWDSMPPLKESEEELLVAREYTGRCLRCHLDIQRELAKLRKTEPEAGEADVIPLRGWQNRMDPCFRFPHEELRDLFMSATVTELRFVALEHMQVNYVTVAMSGLRKFRRNTLSFPQDTGMLALRHELGHNFADMGEEYDAGGDYSGDWELCDIYICRDACEGDVESDDVVGVEDLLAVIADWGCSKACEADLTGDGLVTVEDLLVVIANWGNC